MYKGVSIEGKEVFGYHVRYGNRYYFPRATLMAKGVKI